MRFASSLDLIEGGFPFVSAQCRQFSDGRRHAEIIAEDRYIDVFGETLDQSEPFR